MNHHDVGGAPVHEAISREQHAIMPWELRVDALMWILTDANRAGGRRMTVDELRRGIEELPAAEYRERGYFSKWLRSMIALMAERGLVDRDDLERRVERIAAEHEAEHHR
ncbi:MAG TPA: hypothetical protein VGN11_02575 [Candidatus Baltobacteraceae bacterium]|nr:hypothetical protein [Candidatus Baltobacteraceae bacterium]